jgi:hypothetical protein
MARKLKVDEFSTEAFNEWAKFIGFGSRFDYTNLENRELVRRIEDAKYAMMHPREKSPSELLQTQTQEQGIFSGIKTLLYNFF